MRCRNYWRLTKNGAAVRRKTQRILIAVADGVASVDAIRVLGQWAVHQAPGHGRTWAVTHVGAGHELLQMRRQRDALKVLKRLEPVEFSDAEVASLKERARSRLKPTLQLAYRLRDIRSGLRAFGVVETAGGLSELREEKKNETADEAAEAERGGESCSEWIVS
jgi:hypothetical protein